MAENNNNEQKAGGFNSNEDSLRRSTQENTGNNFVQGYQEQFLQQLQLQSLKQLTQQYLDQQQQELAQPQTMQLPPPESVVAPLNEEAVKAEEMKGIEKESDVQEKPKPQRKKNNGKIHKKERQMRRKILQPKNAMMVLNELIGSGSYNVTETVVDIQDGTMFRCAIAIGDLEHAGVAKSKAAAKTSAAEAALKHIVLNRMKNAPSAESTLSTSSASKESSITNENLDEEMSWSPIASYALHNLLSRWNEGLNEKGTVVQKPSKKIPNSAASMNPLMLLNQMYPETVYEELGQFGNPPHAFFRMKCVVSGQTFIGVGLSKKEARKMCAFEACHKILGIEYSPEYLEEHGASKANL